jgi:hypothetical protein
MRKTVATRSVLGVAILVGLALFLAGCGSSGPTSIIAVPLEITGELREVIISAEIARLNARVTEEGLREDLTKLSGLQMDLFRAVMKMTGPMRQYSPEKWLRALQQQPWAARYEMLDIFRHASPEDLAEALAKVAGIIAAEAPAEAAALARFFHSFEAWFGQGHFKNFREALEEALRLLPEAQQRAQFVAGQRTTGRP